MGIEEKDKERTQDKAKEVLMELADVELHDEDIIACHRIPGKKDKPRPILVKVRNSDVKARVMRKRSTVKEKGRGIRLVDDVTADNTELITALLAHDKIESAWYFNGAVYGKPFNKKRMTFQATDIFDLRGMLSDATVTE